MDLSIVIPCHNLENHILPLLVSLNLQLVGNYKVELIFVCDGCTDGTKDKIENFFFRTNYQKVTIIECNHCFCGLARNEGKNIAKGKYILFLDGDDWLVDTYALHKIITFLNSASCPVMKFGYEAPGFYSIGHPSMVWQYAYTKDFIKEIDFPAIHPHEDFKFNKEVAKNLVVLIKFHSYQIYYIIIIICDQVQICSNYMKKGE